MAGITHYINTAATEPTRARWPSLINDQPEPFPVLILGDTRPHRFFFHYDGTIEDFSGSASYDFRVTIGDVSIGPVGGTYTLTCGETTTALAFDAAAGTIQAALNALATVIAAGNVTVSGTFPNFLVSWNSVGVQTALTASSGTLNPAGAIGVTSLQTGSASVNQQTALQLRQNPITTQTTWSEITSPNNGWSGTLTTNTAEAIALLISQGTQEGEIWQYSTVLQAEVINASGEVVSYYQVPIILRASNLDSSSLNPTPFPSVAYVQNRPLITGLVSAVVNSVKLGGLPTASGQMPSGAVVLLNFSVTVTDGDGTHTGLLSMFYRLTAGVQAQSHPIWIQPYDYNASTNAYVWKLIGTFLDLVPASYNTTTGKFHYMGVAGAAGACYAYPDQTGSSAPA
jgi:hypothetical protein